MDLLNHSSSKCCSDYCLDKSVIILSFISLIVRSLVEFINSGKHENLEKEDLKKIILNIIIYVGFASSFILFAKLTNTHIGLFYLMILVFVLNANLLYEIQLGLLCFSLLSSVFTYFYFPKRGYKVLRLIQLVDIVEEVLPRILISICIFSIVSEFLNLKEDIIFIKEEPKSFIKYGVFVGIILYFVLAINVIKSIKTIFPSFTVSFIFTIIVLTFIYLDLVHSCSIKEVDILGDEEVCDIMGICFYKRYKIIVGSDWRKQDLVSKILSQFKELGMYALIKNIEKQDGSNSEFNIFPEWTPKSIDDFLNSDITKFMNMKIRANLEGLRDSYKKNWISVTHDKIDSVFYKLYKKVMQFHWGDDKYINVLFLIFCSAILCIIVYIIFSDMILCIVLFLLLVKGIQDSFNKYNFFQSKEVFKVQSEELNDELDSPKK